MDAQMNDFNVSTRNAGGIQVLELHGYLDAHTAPVLEESIQKLLSDNQYRIVVNCRNLSYISSAGLGVFMAFIEDVRSHDGDIKLSNMTPKVFDIFDLLGFPHLYDITDDEAEAILRFSEKKKK